MEKLSNWDARIGRRVRIRDLHVLLSVVQHGSMARAAAHLNVSQPAISDAVATLEAALGVRLLDRSRKGVEPTVYGATLLKYGSMAIDDLRQGIKEIEFLADPAAGELRIECPESVAAGPLVPIIERLTDCYPRVSHSFRSSSGLPIAIHVFAFTWTSSPRRCSPFRSSSGATLISSLP